MGELKNCSACGKVFVKLNRNICPACMEKEEQEYEEVRKYLKDNPGASVEEITEATGVDEKKVFRWIREGRIDADLAIRGGEITCTRCGAVISFGSLCSKCSKLLTDQMQSMSRSAEVKDQEPDTSKDEKRRGMFVADRLRKE